MHNLLNGTWTPRSNCGGLSLAVVIGSSMGTLLFIGLCLLIAAVVIININDLRRWKQYQAWRRENEERLGAVTNPLYEVSEVDRVEGTHTRHLSLLIAGETEGGGDLSESRIYGKLVRTALRSKLYVFYITTNTRFAGTLAPESASLYDTLHVNSFLGRSSRYIRSAHRTGRNIVLCSS